MRTKEPLKTQVINIYTDGACLGNPGAGGWAFLLQDGCNANEKAGFVANTTNNRMELMAVIQALKKREHLGHEKARTHIYTDSQYVKNGITLWIKGWKKNGWRTANKQPVKNQDLWKQLDLLAHNDCLAWHWVRGHSGHHGNERVDSLARQAALGKPF